MAWKQGKDLVDMLSLLVQAIDTISKLTRTTADDRAAAVLKAIATAVTTVKAGVEGRVSVEAAELALEDLTTHLAHNDAAADRALQDKFDLGS